MFRTLQILFAVNYEAISMGQYKNSDIAKQGSSAL